MNDDLYQDLILERARRPSGLPAAADRRADLDNPFCGDHITVAVRLEDGRVAEIGYEGEGCALARASASMMTDAARGRTREEMSALFKRLQALIAGTPDPELGDLAAFAGVAGHPSRRRCVTLAWEALLEALRP